MNKINEFLTKAADEPNFADAVIYLQAWHQRVNLSIDQLDEEKDEKLIVQFAQERKQNIKPIPQTDKMDAILCAELVPFIKDTNLTDVKNLLINSVTGHLSTQILEHTEAHQQPLENLQKVNSLFSKLIEVKRFYIEDEKGRFSEVVENLD